MPTDAVDRSTRQPTVGQAGVVEFFDITGNPGEVKAFSTTALLPLEAVERFDPMLEKNVPLYEGTDYTVTSLNITLLPAFNAGTRYLKIVYRTLPAVSVVIPPIVGLKDTTNAQIDPATKQGVTEVRDRLPAVLDADGGVKVHVQNTVPVSGALTDAELRATPVPVDTELIAAGPLATEATLEAVGLDVEAVRDRLPAALETGRLATSDKPFSSFARMTASAFADTEEQKIDVPTSLVSASIFLGFALDASAEGDAVWTIVRIYFDANALPTRRRIKSGISWTDRANAANWP